MSTTLVSETDAGGRVSSYVPIALSVLRIMAALLFMEHGLQKLFGFPLLPPSGALPAAFSLGWYSALIEAIGGVLLAIGLFSRVAAFIMSGEMAVAYFMAHAPRMFWPVGNGGDAAILFCFVFLFIAVAGPGPLSVDAAMRRGS